MLTTPAGVTFAHRVVAEVGDVEVAGRVEGQGVGIVEPGSEGADTVPAGVTSLTVLSPALATKRSPAESKARPPGR